jgi:molecular chaperone DnaK
MKEIVVGIDLGTTNSLIGTVSEGRVRLFSDADGRELLPSAVGVAESGLLIGRPARNHRLVDPDGTVTSIKRKMGQDVRVGVGSRELTPQQVSALILGRLLDWVERDAGRRPARAVITVPAYFDDAQRQATRDAGAIAGLSVERLVNEPTAAALTYETGTEERVMIYDLGGGTFDVSVLERDRGFLEVRASRGDTKLGGDDIDVALLEQVLDRLGSSRAIVERDRLAMVRLLEAVERAKIALSDRTEAHLFDPYLAGQGASAVHLELSLLREHAEQAARPFVLRTLSSIDEALRDARLAARDLDRVILVGGASKMPLVARLVSEHLGRPVIVDPNADRAVALGASKLAGRIAGEAVDEVLVDITPHTLSVGSLDETMLMGSPFTDDGDLRAVPLIERDTVVPVEKRKTVFTLHEDQEAVSIPIVQGEGHRVGDNTWLGRVEVVDLPPSPAQSSVEVSFRLDLSGILHVSAIHVPSGKSTTVSIAQSPSRLSEQRREAARREVEAMRAQPAGAASVGSSDLALARALIVRAERALEKTADPGAGRARVERALGQLQGAVREGHLATIDRIDELSDALFDLT